MNPEIKHSTAPSYSVQIQIETGDDWRHIYRTLYREIAISEAGTRNRQWKPGLAAHRVVREQDGKVLYQRGWVE